MTPFPKAVRRGTYIVGAFVGGSGSGKTYSAIKFASGLVRKSGKRMLVLDTENGRALHYSDMADFDHAPLSEPFRPEAYGKIIEVAVKSGEYGVIAIDSFSHEFAGYGGLVDWHDEILEAKVERARQNAGDRFDEWKVRESLSVGAWAEPKQAHKKFFQWLLQQPIHILLCIRAEEKIEFGKENGKTVIKPSAKPGSKDGWVAVAEKTVIFEATFSILFLWTDPGAPNHIKVQEQHCAFFPEGKQLTAAAGEGMAEWAGGGLIDAAPLGVATAYADRFAKATTIGELEKAWPGAELGLMDKENRNAITVAYKARAKQLGAK